MTRFHSLRVAEVRRLTPDAVAISFAVPDDLRPVFAFMPGQYLTLRATIDGEDIRRCYSLCSTPDAPLLTVGVKQVEGGAFSTFANQSLKVGDVLEVMAPEGRFALPGDQPGRHALAIVAGSGITPVLSIAARLLASDAAARAGIDLPYSCKGGMCCTCRCRAVSGEVEMAVNYSLEPWELESGFRLACQSTPKTATLSLDFDQI